MSPRDGSFGLTGLPARLLLIDERSLETIFEPVRREAAEGAGVCEGSGFRARGIVGGETERKDSKRRAMFGYHLG